MKRLMDVSGIMDNKSQGKGLGVIIIWEGFANFLDIDSVFHTLVTFEEFSESVKSIANFDILYFEVEIREFATLVKVGLIDEMPVTLP